MAISEHLLQAVKLNLASIKNILFCTNILSYRYRKRLGLVKFGSAAPTGLVQSQVFSLSPQILCRTFLLCPSVPASSFSGTLGGKAVSLFCCHFLKKNKSFSASATKGGRKNVVNKMRGKNLPS